MKILESTNDSEFIWLHFSEEALSNYNTGRYGDAISHWEEAYNIAADFENNDPRKACSINNIGVSHRINNNFEKAENYYKKAMKIWKNISSWLDTMQLQPRARSTLHHLRMENKYRKYYDRIALQKYKAISTAGSAGTLNNIAELLHNASRMKEAQKLYEEALSDRENSLGINEWGAERIRCNIKQLSSSTQNNSSSAYNGSNEAAIAAPFSSQAMEKKWIIDSPSEFTDEGRLMAAILMTHIFLHLHL